MSENSMRRRAAALLHPGVIHDRLYEELVGRADWQERVAPLSNLVHARYSIDVDQTQTFPPLVLAQRNHDAPVSAAIDAPARSMPRARVVSNRGSDREQLHQPDRTKVATTSPVAVTANPGAEASSHTRSVVAPQAAESPHLTHVEHTSQPARTVQQPHLEDAPPPPVVSPPTTSRPQLEAQQALAQPAPNTSVEAATFDSDRRHVRAPDPAQVRQVKPATVTTVQPVDPKPTTDARVRPTISPNPAPPMAAPDLVQPTSVGPPPQPRWGDPESSITGANSLVAPRVSARGISAVPAQPVGPEQSWSSPASDATMPASTAPSHAAAGEPALDVDHIVEVVRRRLRQDQALEREREDWKS